MVTRRNNRDSSPQQVDGNLGGNPAAICGVLAVDHHKIDLSVFQNLRDNGFGSVPSSLADNIPKKKKSNH
jgi:hypothetical protein